ncbi:MAG: Fibrillarin-like rRNA/tRNA 2'-O-methyltransferase [Promethearchaeota archaeon]|nr:MAG: Fibrillarin-like rRNA/tRNA 2'-O-methyltransferase [Candidatus Lokiarchaeota archaeon]
MSQINIRSHPKYTNLYISGPLHDPKLFTKNLDEGTKIYGEKLFIFGATEYREWIPHRSKLAAVLLNQPKHDFLKKISRCLYLGAASGTTISHLSDILVDGVIYSVEFAERSMRQLIQNTSERDNVIPILADARHPEQFGKYVFSEIDFIYQDVAQPNQAEIAIRNGDYYLKEGGFILVALKSQSIDSTVKPEKIYSQERKELENSGYKIIESFNIHKYAANHIVLLIQKE